MAELLATPASARALTFAVGGVGVRLRIESHALAERLLPALEPLASPVEAAIEVVAVEGEPPPAPWNTSDEGEHYAADDRVQVLAGAESVLGRDGDRGAFWVRDAEALPRWETAAPLRTLLRWLLRDHGLHFVHGAAVVGARGAALLAGASGAGKSTTALAAADAGLGYVGDDYCAVALRGPAVHALYAVGKVDAEGLRRVAGGAATLRVLPGGPTPDGKHLVVPPGLTRSAPLVSIVLPHFGIGPLTPASPAEALRALATSILLLPRSTQADLDGLGELVRALPAYRLPLGDDPVAALREHLA